MLLVPEVMAVVSKLPLLKSLAGHYVVPADLSRSLSCILGSDSFPLLERFELDGWLKPATSLLKSWVPPVSLTSLRFMEYKAIQPENYLTITEWVASHLPLLTGLVISYDEDEIEEHNEFVDPLPFSIFESLFSCEHLLTLTIAYPVPFEMTEAQLVSLVTALPLLSDLEIGCSRDAPESEPSLALSALSSIAPLCNSLKYLSIYLSCHTTSHLDHVPDTSVRFKCLESLDVSKSPIQSPISVALFMSRILPETCSLDHTESLGIEDEERDAEWTQAVMVLQALRIKYREAKKNG
ncbi:hypothetical protein ONZ45_g5658 [Pleurotus djamor]|nr:hypothetical protein ONZ45_g5658 [Pleurotus djamor]